MLDSGTGFYKFENPAILWDHKYWEYIIKKLRYSALLYWRVLKIFIDRIYLFPTQYKNEICQVYFSHQTNDDKSLI